jgi:ABC-type transporter Mla subunit MlaD
VARPTRGIAARAARSLRSVRPVKLPLVPGPSDVRAAVDGVRHELGEAIDLVPRLARVLGSVEEMVGRAGTLLDRVEGVVDRAEQAMTGLDETRRRADETVSSAAATLERADAAVRAAGETLERTDATIAAAAGTQEKADEAITAVGRTTDRADRALDRADGLVGRLEPLVGSYEEPLTKLAPSVHRLADTLEPDEVEAMVRLIDQLPSLVTHLDEVVLPVLASMGNVGDDVHDLLDTMQDLRQVVKGFPGSRLFRRRGADEIAEDDEEAAGT